MNSKLNPIFVTQAAGWYARLRAPDCSEAERRAFQQWLAADVEHEKAYEGIVRAADRVTQQAKLDPRLQALAAKALETPATLRLVEPVADESGIKSVSRHNSPLRTHWRSAAVLVISVGAAALVASKAIHAPTGASPMTTYVNNESRERQIKLSDGSTLHLDVDAEINVTMSPAERHLELAKGRAYFEVAHDKQRPFSVTAGGTRTVALGTRFEVALRAQEVSVSLAEGSVAITNADATDASEAETWREVLTPGQQLQIHSDHDQRERTQVDASTIASWSTGRLIFNGMPLNRVLDEINRYASIKVHLGDTELANIPIGGNFVAGADSNEFVETLAAVVPLRSVRTGANEIVLFQRYESNTH
jgi:transmembrane sensor